MWQKFAALGIAVFGFNLFLFGHPIPYMGSLGFLAAMLWLHAWIVTGFFQPKSSTKQNTALAASGLAIFLTALSVLRANEIDVALLTLASLALSAASLYLFTLQHHAFGALSEVVVIPLQLGFGWLFSAIQTLTELPEVARQAATRFNLFPQRKYVSNTTSQAVMRALLITIPLVLIIGALLSSADPIFSKVVGSWFDFSWLHFTISVPLRIVQSLLVAALVLPFLLLRISDRFHSPLQKTSFGKFHTEAMIVVGAVAALIGVFLLIQFRYLFANVAEVDLHQFGVQTYSEYVRRGFGELVLVACIVYGVVGASMLVLRQHRHVLLRNINLLLLSESLVFIFSIFRRVLLYQAEHGLTRIRVYGSFFLVMLIALTIILMLRHVVTRWTAWYRYEFGVIIGTLVLVSFMNVDHLIATTYTPTVNQEIDYGYISRLSADGAGGWLKAIEHAQSVALTLPTEFQTLPDSQARELKYANEAINEVWYNYSYLVAQYGTKAEKELMNGSPQRSFSWQRVNAGELAAYQQLRQEIDIAALSQLRTLLNQWYGQLTPQQQFQPYDRSSDTPLL